MTDVSKAEGGLTLVEAETAAEICRDLDLGEEPRALLDDELTPEGFLDRLLEAGLLADAVSFLAHALPKREAVWWACLSVRTPGAGAATDGDRKLLEIAEAWVESPDEETRVAALEAAEQSGYETAASWAAAAAAWSGGSLAPAGLEAVPPGETLTAKAVTAAVMLAAAAGEPLEVEPRQREFLACAREVAGGGRRWQERRPQGKEGSHPRERKGRA